MVTLYNKVPLVNALANITDNKQCIYYSIYQSLLKLVNKIFVYVHVNSGPLNMNR